KPQLIIDENPELISTRIPHLLLNDTSSRIFDHMVKGTNNQANLKIEGLVQKKISGRNVVSYIEGADPELKNEFVMLSAHYDHIGIGQPNAMGDSIYNGARDNAVGTV